MARQLVAVVCVMNLLGSWTRIFGQDRRLPEWNRASAAYAHGRFDEADAWAAQVLARDPRHIDAERLRGTIALWRNDVRTAETRFRAVLARAPRDRGAAARLTETLSRQDRFQEAAQFATLSGDRARARMLASFGATVPYRAEGTVGARPLLQVNPLPLVELTVDETVTGVFLVDTGGADVIIDPAVATRLGVPTFGSRRGLFGGGAITKVTRARLATVRVGPLLLHDLPATVMPTRSLLTAPDGRALDGIVGTSIFSRVAATIDYVRGELVLSPKSDARRQSCAEPTVVPFWLADDHFIVAKGSFGTLNDQLFIVDTGVGGAAVAPSKRVLELAGIRTEAPTRGTVPGGAVSTRSFTVPRLALGTYAREQMRGLAGVFPESLRTALGFDVAGLLGHDFFGNLRITFDFERMEILLCSPTV